MITEIWSNDDGVILRGKSEINITSIYRKVHIQMTSIFFQK